MANIEISESKFKCEDSMLCAKGRWSVVSTEQSNWKQRWLQNDYGFCNVKWV